MSYDIVTLFCEIDDFCQRVEPEMKRRMMAEGTIQRQRSSTLCLSEVMTILVWFQSSGYRTFKDYYRKEVQQHLTWAFPKLVSYNRFVELMPSALLPLVCYLQTRKGCCSGVSFIDSMALTVCHNRRIGSHRVFGHIARRGKNSVGWFYGFKLHLVINDQGELLAFQVTPANVDDRKPVPTLVQGLFGKLFGDRGYICQALFEQLFEQGLQLITKLKRSMKNRLMPIFDNLLLRKRVLIETVHDQLKNISQIEHHRHRSVVNFLVNLVAALIAYTYQPKKPSLHIRQQVLQLPMLMA